MPYRKIEHLTRELHALTEVATILATRLELRELLQQVVEKITEVLELAEFGLIILWDESAQSFRPLAASGPALSDPETLFGMTLRAGESITGRVFAEGKARLLATPAAVAAEKASMRPANRDAMHKVYGADILPKSAIAAPLCVGEQNYGVLLLETLHNSAAFSESDLPFVQTLADLIALELDRDRLDAEARAIRDVRDADRLRIEVMAAFSHELRTPLAAIKGYATALLLDEVEWPEEKRLDFLRLIEEECDNLEGMIGEILDSALIDIGQLEIEPQPIRLPQLAQEVAQEMQRFTETHRLVMGFPPDFPLVDADPHRIKQVFRNILDNAIKYAPNGGLIMIRGQVRAADVVISIADQGVGISPEDMLSLFDKYFRVKASTGYHIPGTGLGLPVSRTIVEAHGGRIWAESKVGEGTILSFSIPITEGDGIGKEAQTK